MNLICETPFYYFELNKCKICFQLQIFFGKGFETSCELTLPKDRQITTEARLLDHKKRLLLLSGLGKNSKLLPKSLERTDGKSNPYIIIF